MLRGEPLYGGAQGLTCRNNRTSELTTERGKRKLDERKKKEARYNLKYRNIVLRAHKITQLWPLALLGWPRLS